MGDDLKTFIEGIPKAELHVHIEGTLEPELMLRLARRNSVELKYDSIEEIEAAYRFGNLQDFLNIYYEGMRVLITEEDFYDLAMAYLKKAHSENVLHSEVFFDPQAHLKRGIEFETFFSGISRAMGDAERELGISSKPIMCFLRDLSEGSATKTLADAAKYKEKIVAVGLDSAERGNPPSKFQKVFADALGEGYLTVAHAGEEGPPEYIWEAIKLLHVSRIDHGVASVEDPKLVEYLAEKRLPLTMCPLSNLKLKVVKSLNVHPLKKLMDAGVVVTVNSDDPAYFGGYVDENYLAICVALGMGEEDVVKLAKNSFEASFITDAKKKEFISKIDEYV